jgi:hypothetical protein
LISLRPRRENQFLLMRLKLLFDHLSLLLTHYELEKKVAV